MGLTNNHDADGPVGSGPRQPFVGSRLRGVAEKLEGSDALDSPAALLAIPSRVLVRNQARRELLLGRWLGHSLHPLLTDFPLGAWMSASLLDLWAGPQSRESVEKLLVFGLVMSVPTAVAGLAEWAATAGGERRVGVVHASVNTGALTLYASSLAARRIGRHRLGVGLGIAGGVFATIGGYLGGHLSLVRGVGVDDNGGDGRD